jgi:hypothetical protein
MHRDDFGWDVRGGHHVRATELFVEALEMLAIARAPDPRALKQLPEPLQIHVGHPDVTTLHGILRCNRNGWSVTDGA